MFRLKIHTNMERKPEVVRSTDMTVEEALKESGVSTRGASVSLNGRFLRADEMDATFAQLGVSEGDTTILSVIVKAESAA